jgi:putative tryptophan/tyrosine transport system substrate-binding protein
MRRRDFVQGIVGSAAAWPLAARAQQSRNKIPVVGVLWHAGSAEEEDVYLSVVQKAFNDLGYIEGKNIHLDHRFPAENPERFRSLARELADEKPDAIIAVTQLAAVELKKATSTIPIVFVLVGDPLGGGLVESLARPGGNVTGVSLMLVDLTGKRLELLKEAVPNLSRVAILLDSTMAIKERVIKANQAAANALGISLCPADITTPDQIEPVFSKIAQDRADAVMHEGGSMLFVQRARVGAAALAHRLPGMTFIAEEVPYGFLMSYGQDLPDYFRRAVAYADKILKGAKPADLPVEQPTKLKLVLNIKTAKALGLTLPQTLILVQSSAAMVCDHSLIREWIAGSPLKKLSPAATTRHRCLLQQNRPISDIRRRKLPRCKRFIR